MTGHLPDSRPDAGLDTPPDVLSARGRPALWRIAILVPVIALLLWMTQMGGSDEFVAEGRRAGLMNALGPSGRLLLFGGTALLCIGLLAVSLWRRMSPREEVRIDADGVTSRSVWGAGTLRWSEITRLQRQPAWLFVHGVDEGGGSRKLAVSLNDLDQSGETVIGAILARRPDLAA